jgi:hypothetical protein
MKHNFLSLLLALVMLLSLVPPALATVATDVTLKFVETEQTLFVGKTKTIKPTLENYKKKATYSYTTEDDAVATVNSLGTVKGIGEGTTVITCVASTAVADYTASYTLTVLKAVTSINMIKSITIAMDTTYTLTTAIKPENATIQKLAWSSSKESVVTVNSNGVITAHAKGTAKITAAATDGSDKKATVMVTVKESIYNLAYEKKGKEYSVYWLIDTDGKIVRSFTSNDNGVYFGKYIGELNYEIDVHYTVDDIHDYIRYEYMNDDASIVIKDMYGFEYKAVKTDVSIAETILIQDGYHDM